MSVWQTITKEAALLGGSVGSLVALSHLTGISRWQSVVAYGTGLACAWYLEPLVRHFMNLPASLSGPVGFVLGATGLGLVNAGIKISQDPLGAWRRLKGENNG